MWDTTRARLGAFLTTPEVITQILMFIPLQGLYELSVWIAGYWELDEAGKKRAKAKLAIVVLLVAVGMFVAAWFFKPGFHEWVLRLVK